MNHTHEHMFHRLVPYLLLPCMIACQPGHTKTSTTKDSTTITTLQPVDTVNTPTDNEAIEDENAEAYVLVADTGNNYYALRSILQQAHEKTGRIIDSLGRAYYPEKDSILLPADDEDEMWAGDYYPRQTFDDFLSIEYVSQYRYKENYEGRTMAAVLGIYTQPSTADSILQLVKPQFGNAHVIKTTIYLGCMH